MESLCDWDNLFISLRKYLESFRNSHRVPSLGSFGISQEPQRIRHIELAGLFAWLNLAEVIAREDPESRRYIYENRQWNAVEVLSGMLTSSFPISLKGALYRFLAALAMDEQAALRIWDAFSRERVAFIHPQTGKLDGIQVGGQENRWVKGLEVFRGV